MNNPVKNHLKGVGSVLNIWPSETKQLDFKDFYPHKSEKDALQQDYEKIGQDFYDAIEAFDEIKHEQKGQAQD